MGDINQTNQSLKFEDTRNFLIQSQEKLANSWIESNHVFTLFTSKMKKICYSDNLINTVKRWCLFPYEYVTSETVLKETCVPSKDNFVIRTETE